MKPTFALDLTRDTIALLHRNPKGWLSIGEVAFDAPDLDEALDYLRKTALGLSPMGMACKIVLPDAQVLYTEIEAPGPSRNDKRRQIAAALEGRTPYPVDDLVFDWSGKGATVKVAVVARETLAEAEAFAVAHRLNPVSIVAVPAEGSFVGEAWFGPTAAAETLLAPGEVVDRDREPVVILRRDLPVPRPSETAAGQDTVRSGLFDDDEHLPGLAEALSDDVADTGDAAAPSPEPDLPEPDLPDHGPAAAYAPALGPEPDGPADAALSAALASLPDDADPVPPADRITPDVTPDPDVEEAPFAHVTDATAFPDGDDEIAPRPLAVSQAALTDKDDGGADSDIPAAPSAAATAAFASRRAAAGPAGGASQPARVALPAGSGGPRLGQPIPRPSAAKEFSGLVTAPSIPGTRAKAKARVGGGETSAAAATGLNTVKSPARPGGTFGTAAPPRNRSGVVFMVLVALLLLFLVVIAAWSSFWLSQNGAEQSEADQAVIEVVPGVDDEMLADMQDPEGMMDPLPEADGAAVEDAGALATEPAPINLALEDPLPDSGEGAARPDPSAAEVAADLPAADTITALSADAPDAALPGSAPPESALPETALPGSALPETALPETALPDAESPDAALIVEVAPESGPESGPEAGAEPVAEAALAPEPEPTPEPAPGTAITTELAAAQQPPEDQDEIFLAAMDAPPPALDALALPAPAAVADAVPEPAMPPPAFGTVYQFDAAGLLKPTPEGILSPEGVMLIAGKPPLIPPARSEAATAAALAAVPAAPVLPDASAAAGPADAPTAAGASLVTATDVPVAEPAPADPAMAGFRPRPRPVGLAPLPEDDAAVTAPPATATAGLRPLARPASVLASASAARPADKPADLGAQGASLTAQADADLAAAAALEAQNPSIVAISMRPAARPRDLSRAVEAAVAAAVRAPDPQPEPQPEPEAEVVVAAAAAPAPDLKPDELDEVDEPDTSAAAPKIPTKASVAKQATYKNAINLSNVNLIGTYGTESKRYALVRQANGRYKKVKVGDKIDGGTVKAITASEVRYQKGGKLLTLKMPKA